jgi:hypothetical protein
MVFEIPLPPPRDLPCKSLAAHPSRNLQTLAAEGDHAEKFLKEWACFSVFCQYLAVNRIF